VHVEYYSCCDHKSKRIKWSEHVAGTGKCDNLDGRDHVRTQNVDLGITLKCIVEK